MRNTYSLLGGNMKTLKLTNLQNAEHLSLMSDILILLEQANIEEFTSFKEQIAKQVKLERSEQNKIIKSIKTKAIKEMDKKRDKTFRGLTLRVHSEILSLDPEIKKSAENIKIVLDNYGNITRLNFENETTQIKNLLAVLNSEKYITSAQRIGISNWMNWLEETNNQLIEIYTARRNAYANRPKSNLINVRTESDRIFKDIRKTANALKVLKPTKELTVFIKKANISILKWKNILNKRKQKKYNFSN